MLGSGRAHLILFKEEATILFHHWNNFRLQVLGLGYQRQMVGWESTAFICLPRCYFQSWFPAFPLSCYFRFRYLLGVHILTHPPFQPSNSLHQVIPYQKSLRNSQTHLPLPRRPACWVDLPIVPGKLTENTLLSPHSSGSCPCQVPVQMMPKSRELEMALCSVHFPNLSSFTKSTTNQTSVDFSH